MVDEKKIDVFVCGGDCPKGGDHVWDGPEYDDGLTSSKTCSKCSMRAIDYDTMHAP